MRLFLIFLALSWSTLSAGSEAMEPQAAIAEVGSITLSDGSSWYTFFKDGGFQSGPLAEDGRRLEGKWVRDEEGLFQATAEYLYYQGEAVRREGWRRLRFRIAQGVRRPFREENVPAISEFHAYFLIEELVRIPPPEGAAVP